MSLHKSSLTRVLLLTLVVTSLAVAKSADAATITVNDLSDVPANLTDPQVTLRDAIQAANNDVQVSPGGPTGSGADVIDFSSALTLAGSRTIKLTLFDTGIQNGEFGPTAFKITSIITITGPAGDFGITIERDGNSAFRFFHVVAPSGNLTLENLTLTGGVAQGGHSLPVIAAGGGGGAGVGGAILNDQALTIRGCTFTDNQAIGGSGAGGFPNDISGGGAGGGGAGGNSATTASDPQDFHAGGAPNGGNTNGENGGLGGGGAGGNGDNVGADPVGSDGGNGGFFGGGGGGGGALGSGATSATGGDGGDGGFGGGGGGGGPARGTGGPETGGAGGAGGPGAGAGSVGGEELGGVGGSGGGGAGMGGAIFNRGGTAHISNSTFSRNDAIGGNSGGIDGNGFPNSVFTDGGAGGGRGGALFNRNGTVTINSCTISGNHIAAGTTNGGPAGGAVAAVYNLGDGATATMNLNNSIVANTTGGGNFDFVGQTINAGINTTGGAGNLIEKQSNFAGGIVSTAAPLLAALADNRGPTATHALMTGSPAIDAGNDAGAVGLSTDQRGGTFARIADGNLDGVAHVDIGAFERVDIDYGDAPDFIGGSGPTSVMLETGADDFRISTMGNDAEVNPITRIQFGASHARVAYDATDNELFVVWEGDDDTPPLVDNEKEIFGQRIDASNGALIGSRIRISTMGPNGSTDYGAAEPVVAWDSRDNAYLVVWRGDDTTAPLVDFEFEIFGRRVGNTGILADPQFRISKMGDETETDPAKRLKFGAFSPSVAYNATSNEFLVVWQGTDDTPPLVVNENEIFAQRIGATTLSLAGSRIQVSRMGPDGNATYRAADPAVAWNSVNNRYLVVWDGDDNTSPLVLGEFEIFGKILDSGGGEVVPQFRISAMGPNGSTHYRAEYPAIAYDSIANEFLVVWDGDDNTGALVDNEIEVYGQRVNAQTGALSGARLRISQMGTDGTQDATGFGARVAFSTSTGSFLVVWKGEDNDFEVFGRRVGAGGTLLDPTQLRLTSQGPEGDHSFGVLDVDIAFGKLSNEHLLVWTGEDNTPPLVNDEFEIFGQRVADLDIVDYGTRGADNGPAHRVRTGLQIGALIDSEANGQSSIGADADDLSDTDDEDGAATEMKQLPGNVPGLDVTVTNTTGTPATLYGWVDYDGDGIFENATERASIPVPNGTINGIVELVFPAPPEGSIAKTFVRLRLSTDAAAANATGLASDGEVEDYRMTIPGLTIPSASWPWLLGMMLAVTAFMLVRRRPQRIARSR